MKKEKKKIVTYTFDNLPKHRTNIKAVKRLTEKEINKAALSDPDAQPLTKKDLERFKKVHPPEKVNPKAIRERLNISQTIFADIFGINKRTLQAWEQGERHPRGPARVLLTVIAQNPNTVLRALTGFGRKKRAV